MDVHRRGPPGVSAVPLCRTALPYRGGCRFSASRATVLVVEPDRLIDM